jgi:hypothetical protein
LRERYCAGVESTRQKLNRPLRSMGCWLSGSRSDLTIQVSQESQLSQGGKDARQQAKTGLGVPRRPAASTPVRAPELHVPSREPTRFVLIHTFCDRLIVNGWNIAQKAARIRRPATGRTRPASSGHARRRPHASQAPGDGCFRVASRTVGIFRQRL